ncbi:MAG TPA: hypothetical protein VLG47_01385 [Candidatus Saccharimonadales bacterium]|nr:hypothetical protein [Candidatus Saccharimonadales bacterium]
MSNKLLDFIMGGQQTEAEKNGALYQALIHHEAKIGGKLFGPIPKGTRREFFCLDRHTWVWHEEWTDKAGHHVMTTRYDVRPNGIFKSQGSSSYQALSPKELDNLYNAIEMYYQQVIPELIRFQQPIGN